MLKLLHRLLFRPRHPETHMTQEQVLALAAEAAAKARINHAFLVPTVQRIDGQLTWNVRTAMIGSGWSINIDDSTGEVGPVKRWEFDDCKARLPGASTRRGWPKSAILVSHPDPRPAGGAATAAGPSSHRHGASFSDDCERCSLRSRMSVIGSKGVPKTAFCIVESIYPPKSDVLSACRPGARSRSSSTDLPCDDPTCAG
jgi:hypothetical protein